VTRPLFEQYKEALRKGHLAARAGKIDAALSAYGEAARLAPDRAAPHTSSATALHRAGRAADAHASFERALAIAPDDEATLRARAVVFEESGRSASAAADLERLAEALEGAGRRADALAAARRSVVLTATPARRGLVARLEAPEADRATPAPAPPAASPPPAAPQTNELPKVAKSSRARATSIQPAAPPTSKREASPQPARPSKQAAPKPAVKARVATEPVEPVEPVESEAGSPTGPRVDATEAPVAERVSAEPEAPRRPEPPAEPRVEPSTEPPVTPQAEPHVTPQAEPSVSPPAEAPPDPSIPWPAVDLPSPPPPTPVGPPPNVDTLMADATALIDAGDLVAARNVMLAAVAVHRAAGRPDAALDVCLQLLALAPGDAYVHLAIAGLQLDRGWQTLATEKIALLLRLTALTGDTQAEADVHALAAERVRDEPPTGVGTH
jgi:tetratricopeptide (TPR) repeat protein